MYHSCMRLAAATVLLAFTCAGGEPRSRPIVRSQYDLIVAGGEVVDGTGRARFRADVGIRGDVIVKIGDLSKGTANVRLDARGSAHRSEPRRKNTAGRDDGSDGRRTFARSAQ